MHKIFLRHIGMVLCIIEIRHGVTWLVTESDCARSKHSAICSGKPWRHFFEQWCPCDHIWWPLCCSM